MTMKITDENQFVANYDLKLHAACFNNVRLEIVLMS